MGAHASGRSFASTCVRSLWYGLWRCFRASTVENRLGSLLMPNFDKVFSRSFFFQGVTSIVSVVTERVGGLGGLIHTV